MDIEHLLHKRELYLKTLWYFEGNRDLPIVVNRRIEYVNARTEFLEHRSYIRTMARLRATENVLDNTNEELERTAAALAEAQAENARLRAVMTRILRDDELNADRYKSWIIAALETAPAGEASHGNG